MTRGVSRENGYCVLCCYDVPNEPTRDTRQTPNIALWLGAPTNQSSFPPCFLLRCYFLFFVEIKSLRMEAFVGCTDLYFVIQSYINKLIWLKCKLFCLFFLLLCFHIIYAWPYFDIIVTTAPDASFIDNVVNCTIEMLQTKFQSGARHNFKLVEKSAPELWCRLISRMVERIHPWVWHKN